MLKNLCLTTTRPLLLIALTASLSACGGGSAPPPAAQAQTNSAGTPIDTGTPISMSTGESEQPSSATNNTPDANNVTVDLTVPVYCTTDKERFEAVLLTRINAARAQARSCGDTTYPSADAVAWNSKLEAAAVVHSVDMTTHNFFSHTGSDGSSVSMRVDAQSYNWSSVGENIAAGQRTAEEVMTGWLDSPGHCANLMNARYTEVAVACVEDTNADYSTYWTNVLGTPR